MDKRQFGQQRQFNTHRGGQDNRPECREYKQEYRNQGYGNQQYAERTYEGENHGGSKFGGKPYNKGGNDFKKEGGYKKFDRNFNNKENYNQNGPMQKRQRMDESGAAPMKSNFSKQPQRSLVALAPNPEDAKSKALVMLTNQFRMTIGKNAPQYYMYPMILFHGTKKEGLSQEGYQFTPFDI